MINPRDLAAYAADQAMAGHARVAFAAACIAGGCTPEQTAQVKAHLAGIRVPDDIVEVHRQLAAAIEKVVGRPEPIAILPPTVIARGQQRGRP